MCHQIQNNVTTTTQIPLIQQVQKKRPAAKITSDYEKVAPTIIKEVLIEGLVKAGMPNE